VKPDVTPEKRDAHGKWSTVAEQAAHLSGSGAYDAWIRDQGSPSPRKEVTLSFDLNHALTHAEYRAGKTTHADAVDALHDGVSQHLGEAEGRKRVSTWLSDNAEKLAGIKDVASMSDVFDSYGDLGRAAYEEKDRADQVARDRDVAHKTQHVQDSRQRAEATHPGAVAARSEHAERWAAGGALPGPLYHATAAGSSILRTGLKSREQSRSEVLGGGPEDTVSFTESPEGAKIIAAALAALNEAHADPKVVAWFDKHWMPKATNYQRENVRRFDANHPEEYARQVRERINAVASSHGVQPEAENRFRVPWIISGLAKPIDPDEIGVVRAHANVDALVDPERGEVVAGVGKGLHHDSLKYAHPSRVSGVYNHPYLDEAALATRSGNKSEQGEVRVHPKHVSVAGFEPMRDWKSVLGEHSSAMHKGAIHVAPDTTTFVAMKALDQNGASARTIAEIVEQMTPRQNVAAGNAILKALNELDLDSFEHRKKGPGRLIQRSDLPKVDLPLHGTTDGTYKGFNPDEACDALGRWSPSLRDAVAQWHDLETAPDQSGEIDGIPYDDYVLNHQDNTIREASHELGLNREAATKVVLNAVDEYKDSILEDAADVRGKGRLAKMRALALKYGGDASRLRGKHVAREVGGTEKEQADLFRAYSMPMRKGTREVPVLPYTGFNRRDHPFTGIIRYQGIPVAVENPRGSHRSGIAPDGKPWSTLMHAHYGEVHGLGAVDNTGDKWDAYVVHDEPDAPDSYTVRQLDEHGAFDEPKTFLGCWSPEEARARYLAQYDASGPMLFGGVVAMPVDKLRETLADDFLRGEFLDELRNVSRDMLKGDHRVPNDKIVGWRTNKAEGKVFPITAEQDADHPVQDTALHERILREVAEHHTGERGGDYSRPWNDPAFKKHTGIPEALETMRKLSHHAREKETLRESSPEARLDKAGPWAKRSLEGATPRHLEHALAGAKMLRERLADPATVPRQTYITYKHGRLAALDGAVPSHLAPVAGQQHRDAVRAALAAGKDVSPEVLADYPEMVRERKFGDRTYKRDDEYGWVDGEGKPVRSAEERKRLERGEDPSPLGRMRGIVQKRDEDFKKKSLTPEGSSVKTGGEPVQEDKMIKDTFSATDPDTHPAKVQPAEDTFSKRQLREWRAAPRVNLVGWAQDPRTELGRLTPDEIASLEMDLPRIAAAVKEGHRRRDQTPEERGKEIVAWKREKDAQALVEGETEQSLQSLSQYTGVLPASQVAENMGLLPKATDPVTVQQGTPRTGGVAIPPAPTQPLTDYNALGHQTAEHVGSQGDKVALHVRHAFVPDENVGTLQRSVTATVNGQHATLTGEHRYSGGVDYQMVQPQGVKGKLYGFPTKKYEALWDASRVESEKAMPPEWQEAHAAHQAAEKHQSPSTFDSRYAGTEDEHLFRTPGFEARKAQHIATKTAAKDARDKLLSTSHPIADRLKAHVTAEDARKKKESAEATERFMRSN